MVQRVTALSHLLDAPGGRQEAFSPNSEHDSQNRTGAGPDPREVVNRERIQWMDHRIWQLDYGIGVDFCVMTEASIRDDVDILEVRGRTD